MSCFIDAELPNDPNWYAIGAYVSFWRIEEAWHIEGEVGMSGKEIGWDANWSASEVARDATMLCDLILPFTDRVLSELSRRAHEYIDSGHKN